MDVATADNDLFGSLMTSYLAQMESAMKISSIVSEHSSEEELSADSVITGLVYRLMTPMKDEEMKDSFNEAKKILNISSSDEDLDEDLDEGNSINEFIDIKTTDFHDKVIINRNVKRNNCNCDICIQCRVCLTNYKNYEIHGDKLSQIFKDAIDNACSIHNISI